jgi:hypothetical protein
MGQRHRLVPLKPLLLNTFNDRLKKLDYLLFGKQSIITENDPEELEK